MDWLLGPIDPSRAHDIDWVVAWHARLMVMAWGVIAPLTILVARFLKVTPQQNWPTELDNQFWWRTHWIGNTVLAVLAIVAASIILSQEITAWGLHGILGYAVLVGLFFQVLLGILRGSKGGPTSLDASGSPRGDHYDMTPRRLVFEKLHKSIGYLTFVLACIVILLGLWDTNAPRWMWFALIAWWAALAAIALYFQSRGYAIDTYQAIWGPDPVHPGNRLQEPGWGMRRQDSGLDNKIDHAG